MPPTVADITAHLQPLMGDRLQQVQLKDNGIVALTLSLPAVPATERDRLIDRCKKTVLALPEIRDVWVRVNAPAVADPVPTDSRQPVPGVRHIIAVSSGKGGVGKSTVAVNLAVSLADQGFQVGILDADIYGPNVPVMLGMDLAKVAVIKNERGEDVVKPAFNYGVKMLSMAFLIERDQPVTWRGPMLNGMIRQFLYQAAWGTLDYLIVDMPPGTGDAQLTLVQAVPLAGAIIVTTPQNVSLLDARKGLKMFQNLGLPVLGIVENMSYFIPPDRPDRQYDIFGSGGGSKTALELEVPLLGCIPLEIQLREGGDRGVPIVLSHPTSASAQALRQIAQRIAHTV
jgi:ATP-binding protein involved in chromosome partitioning